MILADTMESLRETLAVFYSVLFLLKVYSLVTNFI